MIVVSCPACSCDMLILEEEINCGIFRHAMFKDGNFINPHLPKDMMEELITEDKIWGCGGPFMLVSKDNTYEAIKCDWI